jgi:hypothetical protein
MAGLSDAAWLDHICPMHGRVLNTPELSDSCRMKTTRYFVEQVLRKRPYLPTEQIGAILTAPLRRSVQSNGRVRHWGPATDPCDGQQRILRIVSLDDGETIHNAFFDRSYREDLP